MEVKRELIVPSQRHVKAKVIQIKDVQSENGALYIVGLETASGEVILARTNEVLIEDFTVGQNGIFVVAETIAGRTGYVDEFGEFVAHKKSASMIVSAIALTGNAAKKIEPPEKA